jgi:hypothetical protein
MAISLSTLVGSSEPLRHPTFCPPPPIILWPKAEQRLTLAAGLMTSLLRPFRRLKMIAESGSLDAARPSVAKARSAARRTRSSGRARRSGSARGAVARWLRLVPTTSRFETACSAPTKRHGAQPCGSARRSALASRTQASTSRRMSGPAPSRRLEPVLPPALIIPAALGADVRSGITAQCACSVARTRSGWTEFPA